MEFTIVELKVEEKLETIFECCIVDEEKKSVYMFTSETFDNETPTRELKLKVAEKIEEKIEAFDLVLVSNRLSKSIILNDEMKLGVFANMNEYKLKIARIREVTVIQLSQNKTFLWKYNRMTTNNEFSEMIKKQFGVEKYKIFTQEKKEIIFDKTLNEQILEIMRENGEYQCKVFS